jgi:hypothetical protein
MHITIAQLDLIEKALKLSENWDKALEAVQEVRDNVADDALISKARDEYQNDDVEIDDDAGTSPHDGGCWVSAWVHLRFPTKECEACDGTGHIDPRNEDEFPGRCAACHGEGEITLNFDGTPQEE